MSASHQKQSGDKSSFDPAERPIKPRPSDDAVVQQRLDVLVAGSGRSLLVAARERRVDVDAGQ